MIVEVQFIGLKEIQAGLKRLEKEGIPKAGRGICKEIAEKITKYAKGFAPHWTYELRKSISTETINQNTFGVGMVSYGLEVEEGHDVPFITPLIEAWALDKVKVGGRLKAFNTLLREGARPSPFMMPAFQIVEAEMDEIINRRIDKAIREELR